MESRASLPRIVSRRHLGHLLGYPSEVLEQVAEEPARYYRPFWQDRPGKKSRRIDHPTGLLKNIQKRIARRLLSLIPLPRELMGGVRGRSVLSNASPHVGQPEVVRIDLANYFGEITTRAVAESWRRWFGAGKHVTWLATRLTTFEGHLPQGAPTSTALANAVLAPILDGIRSICMTRNLRLTVYVDDISLSGVEARGAIEDIARLLSQNGLPMARRKTLVMPRSGRQEVTGVVVNQKLSNGRKRLSHLRMRILRSAEGGASLIPLQGAVAHARAICDSQGLAIQRVLDRTLPKPLLVASTSQSEQETAPAK